MHDVAGQAYYPVQRNTLRASLYVLHTLLSVPYACRMQSSAVIVRGLRSVSQMLSRSSTRPAHIVHLFCSQLIWLPPTVASAERRAQQGLQQDLIANA